MPTKHEQIIGQQSFMSTIDVVQRADLLPPDFPEGLDLNRRTTFSRLITVIGEQVGLTEADTTYEDLERAMPESIARGLYIARQDPRFNYAKQTYEGVAFPAGQHRLISRSPSDLAKQMYGNNRGINDARPAETKVLDRDVVHATAMRAAGHTLEQRGDKLESLRNDISTEHLVLRALWRELRSGGKAHYSAKNLDKLRKQGHDTIHQAVEVAAVNLSWDNVTVDGIQRAVHYNLYGRQGHNNQRLRHWRRYTVLAGTYAAARLEAIEKSMRVTARALEEYQPFLDAGKQTEIDE